MGVTPEEAKRAGGPGTPSGNSAAPFCIRISNGPIVRGEAYAPEARIRFRKFDRRMKFLGLFACDQLYRTFDLLARHNVLQRDDLALIQRSANFHQGAMRVHDDRVSLFTEGRLIGQFPFQDHANLKKQALAAPSSRGIFHYSEAPRIPALRVSRATNLL